MGTNDTPTRITSASDLLARYAAGERDFRDAVLRGADLTEADLTEAVLTEAVLTEAVLTEAVLRWADLSGADLRWAHLSGADLRWAHLSGADLSGAHLSGADLSGADLRWADLSEAHLRTANLVAIRADLADYIRAYAAAELPGLLRELEAGRIDGSTYQGPCACLAGTCERVAEEIGASVQPLIDRRAAHSPRERWFLAIRQGDTPATNPVAAITAEWLRELLADGTAREAGEHAD